MEFIWNTFQVFLLVSGILLAMIAVLLIAIFWLWVVSRVINFIMPKGLKW